MIEPSGVSRRAPFANWTDRHSCGGGAVGFPSFGPCNPRPNSPSLEYAKLACTLVHRSWPAVINGGIVEFVPTRQEKCAATSPCPRCMRRPASSLLGKFRCSGYALRLAPLRFRRCALTGGASVCFVGFCCHCSNLAQMAGDVLGIVVSAPPGSWREQVGSLRGETGRRVSIGGAPSGSGGWTPLLNFRKRRGRDRLGFYVPSRASRRVGPSWLGTLA